MIWKLYLLQFLNDLRHQKLRVFLTLFGLVWGTTSIMLLLAVGEALEKQLFKSMHGMGENIVIMWPGRTSMPWQGFNQGRQLSISREDIDMLAKTIPAIKHICGETRSRGDYLARFGDQELLVDMAGVEPVWAEMRNVIPQQGGRFIHPDDILLKRRVVFLGDKLKDNLFGAENPIGKYIEINHVPFQVIGIMQKKIQNSSYGGRDHSKAIIPISTFMLMYNYKFVDNALFQPAEPGISKNVTKQIIKNLANLKFFNPDDPDALDFWDTTDMDRFMGYLTKGLQLFLGIVGIFTLIVAGIGVANIMNVIVEERTREIGIKMALGIKRHWIMSQFIFETSLLTLIGGSVGFLLTAGFCSLIRSFPIEEYMGSPYITLRVALITTLILGVVAFLAGFFPARRAANLDPIAALRW